MGVDIAHIGEGYFWKSASMIQRDYEYALWELTGHNRWSMYNVQRFQRYENYLLGGPPVFVH